PEVGVIAQLGIVAILNHVRDKHAERSATVGQRKVELRKGFGGGRYRWSWTGRAPNPSLCTTAPDESSIGHHALEFCPFATDSFHAIVHLLRDNNYDLSVHDSEDMGIRGDRIWIYNKPRE